MHPPSRATLGLLIILLLGAGLRCYHLDHGLPDVVYVDAFKFVDAAREMVRGGSWAPRDYQNPGLYTNLLAVLYALTGARSDYWVHLIAQGVSALFGTGLVALTWLAARQVCGAGGALLAAALSALSVVLVTLSRIPATDSILACFMTAGLWLLARENTSPRHLALAGLCAGLALGTKFSGLYFVMFMVLALLLARLRARKRLYPGRALGLCALLGITALITSTPWIVPRFADYCRRFALEILIQNHGQIGRVQHGFFDYLVSPTVTWEQPWLGTSLLYNDGPLLLAASLAACLWALRLRHGTAIFLHALYLLLYLVMISRPGHLKAARFLAPILPSFYILAAWAFERLIARASRARRKLLWCCATVLILAFPVFKSFKYISMTRHDPTDRQAARWIEQNIPRDAVLLASPFFLEGLPGRTGNILRLPQAGARQYRETGVADLNAEAAPVYYPELLDEIRALGARYVVTSSYFDDAFSDIPENRRWFPNATLAYKQYQARLAREGKLAREIIGYRQKRPGPDIKIYILPSAQ